MTMIYTVSMIVHVSISILGGSSYLLSKLVHPSYKWIGPTYLTEETRVI